jgi:antitoxin (DNA-binding transcriptional repressor) of toxin-antitoxin stability system
MAIMLAVGVRDLKAHLSEYLRRVRGGEVVLVTDRGEVVAELRAPLALREVPDQYGGLRKLAERGVATLGLPHDGVKYPSTGIGAPPGTAQALLDEERGDR